MQSNLLAIPVHTNFDSVSQASTDGDAQYQDIPNQKCVNRGKKVNQSSANDKMKTSLCRKFCDTGYCPYGAKCQFAHGVGELRCVTDENKYKTKTCNSFSKKGYCVYGQRCNFLHLSSPMTEDIQSATIVQSGFREILFNGRQMGCSTLLKSLYSDY